ncbi:acyltransferase family protein [Paenibacillus wynnii]|uniref:acyltransferase family protein n=1 Tax=Paenibacillus wynnii TaxID=268407 RepID=UPI00278F2A47|nr:acyltransferase [Paenibacillus wynnii]MDQ0194434.1 peptidoglycan/LPS O-acetylase OafA/YrhL [Paenibacillus wynnii]
MLRPLTSFRFLAALLVFLFHTGGIFVVYGLGSAGVQFFFVLSGFILAYTYQTKLNVLNKENIRRFYLARFAKIYPVHLLTFLLATPLVLIYFDPEGLYAIKLAIMSGINLFLVQSYIPISSVYFNFNSVSWTLSVEAFFYLIFPFLLYGLKRFNIFKNTKVILSLLTLVWAGLFILNLILTQENKIFVWALNIFPATRAFEFMVGVVLGLIFIKRSDQSKPGKELSSNLKELGCLILISTFIMLSGVLELPNMRGLFFVPAWGLLIYTFAFQKGVFSRILSNKYLVYLGEISFSFYMIHALALSYVDYMHFSLWLSHTLSFIIALVLSSIIFKYYEEPLRKKIRFGFGNAATQNEGKLQNIHPDRNAEAI